MIRHHINSRFGCPGRVECTICQKRFICQENLDRHVCTGQVSTSTCPKCLRAFVNGYIMKRHDEEVHLGLRPWPCLICGFAFKCKRSLQRHTARNTCKPRPTTSVEQSNKHRLESIARQASLTLGEISHSTAEHTDEEHANEGMLLDWD
jgi:uncharacterized Zn-finger protein